MMQTEQSGVVTRQGHTKEPLPRSPERGKVSRKRLLFSQGSIQMTLGRRDDRTECRQSVTDSPGVARGEGLAPLGGRKDKADVVATAATQRETAAVGCSQPAEVWRCSSRTGRKILFLLSLKGQGLLVFSSE